MRGLTIHSAVITVHATLDWDSAEWELFTDNPRAQLAARQLNRAFLAAILAGPDRDTVRREMERMMARYADTGAMDTEPRNHLEALLDAVYGQER